MLIITDCKEENHYSWSERKSLFKGKKRYSRSEGTTSFKREGLKGIELIKKHHAGNEFTSRLYNRIMTEPRNNEIFDLELLYFVADMERDVMDKINLGKEHKHTNKKEVCEACTGNITKTSTIILLSSCYTVLEVLGFKIPKEKLLVELGY